jgi:hypothetical protein
LARIEPNSREDGRLIGSLLTALASIGATAMTWALAAGITHHGSAKPTPQQLSIAKAQLPSAAPLTGPAGAPGAIPPSAAPASVPAAVSAPSPPA